MNILLLGEKCSLISDYLLSLGHLAFSASVNYINKKATISSRIFVYFFALMYVASAFMAKPTQMII